MSNLRYEFTEAEKDTFQPHLLYLTESKYESDWHSTKHFHPFMEILFVTNGHGHFLIEEQDCVITRGDIVIINPNQMHTESSTPEDPLEYIIVGVDHVAFDIVRTDGDLDARFIPVYPFQRHYDRAYYYLSQMYKELQEKQANYQLMVQRLLSIFLLYIMRHTNLKSTLPSEAKMSKECAFVKQYIDSHLAEPISLDELADKTFISKFHLIHSFKRYTGMSPINYLIEARLNESKVLLRTTEMSVTDIARAVGFSSPAHFSKRFKTSTDMTPAEYRKKGAAHGS